MTDGLGNMALSPSSRYTQTTDSTGRAVTKRKSRPSSRYYTVIAIEGQTMQEIAALHLGDASLYWRLADVNPQVPYPDEVPAGTRLRLPEA